MMNALELLNRSWFQSLNAAPGTPAGLITFATFCAQYTLVIIPLTLLGHWFLGGKGRAPACAVLSCHHPGGAGVGLYLHDTLVSSPSVYGTAGAHLDLPRPGNLLPQ